MSTSFVKKGDDLIVGFNFDEAASFEFQLKKRADLVYGLLKTESRYLVVFGVNKDGNFGSLLFVPPASKVQSLQNVNVKYLDSFVEDYIYGRIDFDQAIQLAQSYPIVNQEGSSLHAQLSDKFGRCLILEPGRGYKAREEKISVITGFSFFNPSETKDDPGSGYQRYISVSETLKASQDGFSVQDGLTLLQKVTGWTEKPTRCSMIYSANENKAYWCLNGDFVNVYSQQF